DHDPGPTANRIIPGEALPLLDAGGEVRPLDEVEADLIRYAITHYRGQMSEVARRLKIGRSTLYRKLDALGLNSEQAEADSQERERRHQFGRCWKATPAENCRGDQISPSTKATKWGVLTKVRR